jgi:hypothetical protein
MDHQHPEERPERLGEAAGGTIADTATAVVDPPATQPSGRSSRRLADDGRPRSPNEPDS